MPPAVGYDDGASGENARRRISVETLEPTIWGRLVAVMRGEVNTKTLEAYRRAGGSVYDLIIANERRREDSHLAGKTPWSDDHGQQLQALCTWNAFVHQTLGDTFLDADYQADPLTVGFVPLITAKQAQAFYSAVECWLSRARAAESNPNFQIDLPIPSALPEWEEQAICPQPHLIAMIEATKSIHAHAGAALAVFEGEGTPADKQGQLLKLRQIMAEATAKAEYARGLMGGEISNELHERIEQHTQQAIEGFYRLGQLLAMPSLIDRAEPAKLNVPGRISPSGGLAANARPGEGFDPWCMTDPSQRERLKRDREATRAINDMWRYDPNPDSTLSIQRQIDGAFERGDIDYATKPNGQRIGHFQCTPYAPIFVVRRPTKVFSERLGPGQEFTIEISAEGVNLGETYVREVVVGPFGPAPGLDYCDPNEKGPH